MANPFVQYLRDTRGELRHVAWPTRTQTIVYALLVAAISVGIAIYLGFFDLVFTDGVKNALSVIPQSTLPTTQPLSSATSSGSAKPVGTTKPAAPAQTPAKLPSL